MCSTSFRGFQSHQGRCSVTTITSRPALPATLAAGGSTTIVWLKTDGNSRKNVITIWHLRAFDIQCENDNLHWSHCDNEFWPHLGEELLLMDLPGGYVQLDSWVVFLSFLLAWVLATESSKRMDWSPVRIGALEMLPSAACCLTETATRQWSRRQRWTRNSTRKAGRNS